MPEWDLIKLPHIRYLGWVKEKSVGVKSLSIMGNVEYDGYRVTKRYTGVSFNLTQGRKYEFKYMGYSPKRGIPYRKVLVSKDDHDGMIRLEEEPDKWLDV